MAPKQEFLSVIEASRLTGLSIPYLYNLLNVGRLSGAKVDGKWRIERTAFVKRYAHRLTPQSPIRS